jgi:hypothetical protein
MRLLKNIGNTCLISYSVEKAICNMNLSVLQELGNLLGGCLTVKTFVSNWRNSSTDTRF